MSEAEVPESLEERVDYVESRLGEVADMLTDMVVSGDGGAPEQWRLRPFDPQVIADMGERVEAWERLYAFVEYLNATFGAQRVRAGGGRAPLYVRAGWWENPIIVTHLAAMAQSWVYSTFTPTEPRSGSPDMLALITDRIMPTLRLICESANGNDPWGQGHGNDNEWSLEPPEPPVRGTENRELTRRADFEAFVAADEPVDARTGFMRFVAEELAPTKPARSNAQAQNE